MLDGEKVIIEQAILGEASAFGLLYDHYEPQIYRFIYLKVGDREEAEDLTHQVFLQGFLKISDYQYQNFPFSSWLYRIARNEVIDFYRVRKSHLDIVNNDDISEHRIIPDLEHRLAIEKIKGIIPKLKPIEQDVLIMRFVEDLSPSEVARVIGKTTIAVRLIQHRAIQKLKTLMVT